MNQPAPTRRAGAFAWSAALTVLLSAFLLFQVQPLISRTILPWFGGTPAVWTTCMLFFQVLLLGGYAYADLLSSVKRPQVQMMIHVALLAAALAVLPITPGDGWKPQDSLQPIGRILLLLLAHVGLPYFVLSSTGPLVQSWYSRVTPGSPYRLYALSNVGSLAALITYPILVEPRWDTITQGWLWSGGFVLFALLCGDLARRFKRQAQPDLAAAFAEGAPATWRRLAAWLLLPAVASVMLLAVTARICQDIAVSPFMWVAPLSLYLLTFIICFDRESWYRRLPLAVLATFSVLAVCNVMLADEIQTLYRDLGIQLSIAHWDNSLVVEASVSLTMLFLVCMVCHGELVRLKPPPEGLTRFYLMVSAGGALGGLIVGVACPLLLNFNGEWNFGLLVCFLLTAGVATTAAAEKWGPLRRIWKLAAGALILAGIVVVMFAQLTDFAPGLLAKKRSFYGVLSVRQYAGGTPNEGRALFNGRILHGYQHWSPERRMMPTTYYNGQSGIGTAIRLKRQSGPLRVGVVGLGAGTIAAYGEPGDQYRFYEINPQAIEFAEDYFTFLSDSGADNTTVLGDGRIALEHEQPNAFDVLALDAFTGDSIPTHLLTVEAMEVYQRHLRSDGVVCVHISNRHLNLRPVCEALASRFQLRALEVNTEADDTMAEATSSWVLMTRDRQLLEEVILAADTQPLDEAQVLWTDRYSNLLQIMK